MSVSSSAPNQPQPAGTAAAAKVVFFTVLTVLLFVHLFVSFRGLSSPAAMDAAQLAREMARGNGLHTKVVRPYAWSQQLVTGRDKPLAQMEETFQAPLPALVLAPLFNALRLHWKFTPQSRIYLLDRVTAAVSLLFFLGALGMSWLTARLLFDERIAGWMAVSMLACQLLWATACGGLAPMMIFFFFSIAIHSFAVALENQAEDEPVSGWRALGLGVACALLVLTHWMALWLVFGLALTWFAWIKPRSLGLLILLPPLLALAVCGAWNHDISGDVLGATKALLQSAISFSNDSWMLRDFTTAGPPVDVAFLLRKLLSNFIEQLRHLHDHLGGIPAATLFFTALIHPFKRQETADMRRVLALIWLLAAVGMAFVGLPDAEKDDNQLHLVFIPIFAAYGFAFLAVLWSRLVLGRASWWSQHGLAAIIVVVTALPMLNTLPMEVMVGLGTKNQFAHWPPYLPDRFARLRELTTEEEILFTDAPWATAWYADRTSIWLPRKMSQFNEMRDLLKKHGEPAAGLVLTPLSASPEKLDDVFLGSYRDWAAQVMRGYVIGIGIDTMVGGGDFPFREFYPLAGQPLGDGRYIAQMVFMSDRKRW